MTEPAKLGFRLTDEQIDRFTDNFNHLSEEDKRIAIVLAHGIREDAAVEKAGLTSKSQLYRRRAAIIAGMQCKADASDLHLAILAAIGALHPYSV